MSSGMSLNLTKKLLIFSFVLLFIPTIILGLICYYNAKKELDISGEIRLKNNVDAAIGMIGELDEKVKNGNLTLDEAKNMVVTTFIGKKGGDGKRIPLKKLDLGKNGYMFINDKNGVTLYHPSYEKEGKPSWNDQDKNGKFTTRQIVQNGIHGGGFTYYYWTKLDNPNEVAEKIVYSELDPHWGWIVSAGSYTDDFNQGANHILNVLFIVLASELFIGSIIAILFVKHISRPIILVSQAIENVANGNLDIERIVIKNKDETGTLAKSFNQMIENLRELIKLVSTNAEFVAASTEELYASVVKTTQATNQITQTIQDMANGSEMQANYVEDNKKSLLEMTAGIQRIAESSSFVFETSVLAAKESEQGNEFIQKVVQQMASINYSVDQSGKVVKLLEDRSKQIEKITGMIADISHKTNLLALNTAIEAARAGEHGRGFTVVAHQVRKLAEESKQSADQIANLIREIQYNTSRAVEAMDQSAKEVESGMNIVQEAGKAFQRILKAVYDVSSQIQEVSAISGQIATSSKEVSISIQETARITKESASNSQLVATATEEQLASMEELSLLTESLSKVAEQMQLLTKKFKV
jgi:methyl-accepting chemotaxis protein